MPALPAACAPLAGAERSTDWGLLPCAAQQQCLLGTPAAAHGQHCCLPALLLPTQVWTSQLHRRFEEAIAKLGEARAVPKLIMQVRAWADMQRVAVLRCHCCTRVGGLHDAFVSASHHHSLLLMLFVFAYSAGDECGGPDAGERGKPLAEVAAAAEERRQGLAT